MHLAQSFNPTGPVNGCLPSKFTSCYMYKNSPTEILNFPMCCLVLSTLSLYVPYWSAIYFRAVISHKFEKMDSDVARLFIQQWNLNVQYSFCDTRY